MLFIHLLLIGEDCLNAFAQKDEESFQNKHINTDQTVKDFLRNIILIRVGLGLLFVALLVLMYRAQKYYDKFHFPPVPDPPSQKTSLSEPFTGPRISASVESLASIKETVLDTGKYGFHGNKLIF